MEGVASVAEENSASAEEVSASAEEMSAQVEEVVASAQELSSLAEQLRGSRGSIPSRRRPAHPNPSDQAEVYRQSPFRWVASDLRPYQS